MNRAIIMAAACLAASVAPTIAHAEPAVPQLDSYCSAGLTGALTQLPDLTTLLQCDGQRWRAFDDPYPHSDRWLTYTPALTLHGEGQRNREIDSGDWTAYPQQPGARCTAEQVVIVDTGGIGPPQPSTGEVGQPLRLRLQPLLFTIQMRGYCLWQKG
jgi:hypothetical protein